MLCYLSMWAIVLSHLNALSDLAFEPPPSTGISSPSNVCTVFKCLLLYGFPGAAVESYHKWGA